MKQVNACKITKNRNKDDSQPHTNSPEGRYGLMMTMISLAKAEKHGEVRVECSCM